MLKFEFKRPKIIHGFRGFSLLFLLSKLLSFQAGKYEEIVIERILKDNKTALKKCSFEVG
jgi:hypothetical protein